LILSLNVSDIEISFSMADSLLLRLAFLLLMSVMLMGFLV